MAKAIPLTGHLATELHTIQAMSRLWCRQHHRAEKRPCPQCQQFIEYARVKLQRCPYGQQKPVCQKCPIHCYKPAERELAREIMRYAGPRMLLRHPVMAILHLIAKRRPVPEQIPRAASARHSQRKNRPATD